MLRKPNRKTSAANKGFKNKISENGKTYAILVGAARLDFLPARGRRALGEHLQDHLLALQDVGPAAQIAIADHSTGVQAPLGDDVVVWAL